MTRTNLTTSASATLMVPGAIISCEVRGSDPRHLRFSSQMIHSTSPAGDIVVSARHPVFRLGSRPWTNPHGLPLLEESPKALLAFVAC